MTDVNVRSRICMASAGLSIPNSCWQPFIFKGLASCAALGLTGLPCLCQMRKFINFKLTLTALKAMFTLLSILVMPFLSL